MNGVRQTLALVCSILVFFCLLVMHTARSRAEARRSGCSERLRLIGVGLLNYHSAFFNFPFSSGGTDRGFDDPTQGNANRLSGWVGLLPFIEQQPLWEEVSTRLQIGKTRYPPMGPVPWTDPREYPPWGKRPAELVCPTDRDADQFSTAASYTFNYGDGVFNVGAPYHDKIFENYIPEWRSKRGMALRQHALQIIDVIDGTANTIYVSEAKIAGPRVARNVSGPEREWPSFRTCLGFGSRQERSG